ncbi:acyl-CoA dehydrogenase family protein, partial [bacterium]|nr:acyl-CoA dehydrogenase family protein [bacterium]
MDFELTEEQKLIQTTIRRFAQDELAPIADELDQAEEFPWKVFQRMAELGLLGMILPTQYGGSGSDELSLAIVIEEIAQACASTADILDSAAIIGIIPIYHYGN